MNKALILKYKTEFDYWLNGGNVQAYYIKDSKPNWTTDEKCIEYGGYDNFSRIIQNLLGTNDVLIVIDDEYVELRKAGADGKQLQVSYDNGKIWYDKSYKKISWSSSQLVRIKPEAPKFKVGDWVRGKTSKQHTIKKVTSVYSDSVTVVDSTIGINVMLIKDLELWQPKEGEWCWVGYKLMKFNKLIKEDYSTTFEFIFPNRDADGYKIKEHILERHLQVVEPFVGQLPSYLKE